MNLTKKAIIILSEKYSSADAPNEIPATDEDGNVIGKVTNIRMSDGELVGDMLVDEDFKGFLGPLLYNQSS